MTRYRLQLRPIDLLLLLMTVIWGANYSVVKLALDEIPPLAFNSLRLVIAAALLLVAIGATRVAGARVASASPSLGADAGWRRVTARDWLLLAVLGFVGHFVYQLCFIGGIARTTASNTSLIFGCTPVTVALVSAAAGHERVTAAQWGGAALSVAGVYLIVGRGPDLSATSLTGDLLLLGGILCWAAYTVGSRPLLARYTAIEVTGYSMAFGAVLFAPLGLPDFRALDWPRVSPAAWAGLCWSAAFALFIAYLIWYTAVRAIGNVRTAIYSNVTPIIALAIAVAWLGETLTAAKATGAAAIVAGAGLTRLTRLGAAAPPAGE